MPTAISPPENPILQQITYYFSDYNLPKDSFLKRQMNLNQGWVTLECLVGFNRLKALTTDPVEILDAIRGKSQLIEVSNDNMKIRRNPEQRLPDKSFFEALKKRTAYVKGFPSDENLDDIIEFIRRGNYGPVVSYQRRTGKDGTPKDSFYLVYNDVPSCKAFVEAQRIIYKGVELKRMFQLDYYAMKKKTRMEKTRLKKKELQVKFSEKRKETAEKIRRKLPKGALVAFSGIPDGVFLRRDTIKDKLKEIDEQLWCFLHYHRNGREGFVRFKGENSASKVIEKLPNGELNVGEVTIKFRVLEGNEEETFLEKAAYDVVDARRKSNWKRAKELGLKKKQEQMQPAELEEQAEPVEPAEPANVIMADA